MFLTVGGQFFGVKSVAQTASRADSSEVFSLRNRVNRLESEIRRLQQGGGTLPTFRPPVSSSQRQSAGSIPPAVVDGRVIGRSDPMFERLATLTIELKERVNELEQQNRLLQQRLEALESRIPTDIPQINRK
ncbi:MAG: hypothetical protein HC890_12410 [Chloroflexaceae bacterium]|nr:hypothetical protein [Chloroflexaceae bacterium]